MWQLPILARSIKRAAQQPDEVPRFNRSYWPDFGATGQLLTELAEDLTRTHGCVVSVVAGRPLRRSIASKRSPRKVMRSWYSDGDMRKEYRMTLEHASVVF